MNNRYDIIGDIPATQTSWRLCSRGLVMRKAQASIGIAKVAGPFFLAITSTEARRSRGSCKSCAPWWSGRTPSPFLETTR